MVQATTTTRHEDKRARQITRCCIRSAKTPRFELPSLKVSCFPPRNTSPARIPFVLAHTSPNSPSSLLCSALLCSCFLFRSCPICFPQSKAPRTGEGLFPGEVIEVTQVLSSEGSTFLRLANDRGWTYARSPSDGGVLFEDLAGGVSEDT